MARETGPKVVAGKSLGNGGHCLPFPPPPGSGPTLPVVASRELTNPVVSLVPASPWRPRVTPHHRSAAVLPQPRLGNRPRSPRGSEEVWGRGCGLTEQACFGHFGLGGWGINSIPSVAGSELRQLRDCHRRRCLYSAAGDIGRRPLETCRGGGRVQGGWGWGEKVAIVLGGV